MLKKLLIAGLLCILGCTEASSMVNSMEEKVIVRINESVTSVTRKDLDISYVY